MRTWLLLPEPADWRWMLYKDYSPWYPDNMKMFRQPKPGDWKSVIQTVVEELKKELSQRNNNSFTEKTENLEENDALTRLKRIDKKLLDSKNALILLDPKDEAFERIAKNIIKLHGLRKIIVDTLVGSMG